MPEAKVVQRFKVCDLNGWSGEADELYIPEDTQGVRFEAFSAVEEIDNKQNRLLMIVVLALGPQYSKDTELLSLEQSWLLVTPFGNLDFQKNDFSSCMLRENGSELVFTYTTNWPNEEKEQTAPRLQ